MPDGMGAKGMVKALIERATVDSGVAGALAVRMNDRPLVLAYHNVVPDGMAPAGDRSLHLPLSLFIEQIEWVARQAEVVSLPELLVTDQAKGVPKGRQRRVAITFDDAYRGAVTLGLPELARRGLPATVFVAPEFVGGRSFWWDALAGTDGLPNDLRAHALDALGGADAAVRRWAVEQGRVSVPVPPMLEVATEDELRAASAFDGLSFGSHTWGHRNLAQVGPEDAEGELARPLAWLRDRLPRVLSWLSYPYGIDAPALDRFIREAGYTAAVLVSGGSIARGTDGVGDPLRVPRLNVPAGLSRRGLAMRYAGVLGG